MKDLGELLNFNTKIVEFNISFNKITDEGIKMIANYSLGNAILTDFGISSNKGISDASTEFLCKIVERSHIMSLGNLVGTSMSDAAKGKLLILLQKPIPTREGTISASSTSLIPVLHMKGMKSWKIKTSDYELGDSLGKGATGEVFKIYHA